MRTAALPILSRSLRNLFSSRGEGDSSISFWLRRGPSSHVAEMDDAALIVAENLDLDVASPSMNTALNGSRTPARGCVFGTIAGMDPHRHRVVSGPLHDGQELDHVPEPVGEIDVHGPHSGDPLADDVGPGHVVAEGHPGQNGGLGRGVEPSTSAVGSRSASPSAWASASTSA